MCRQCVLTDKVAGADSAIKLSESWKILVQRKVLELAVVFGFDVLKDLIEVCIMRMSNRHSCKQERVNVCTVVACDEGK